MKAESSAFASERRSRNSTSIGVRARKEIQMLSRFVRAAALVGVMATGCATYPYAKNVKMVSFDGNVASGQAVGPVRGESCQASVMGYPIGEPATLDKAMANAREKHQLRYMNNVATEDGGFNAYFYAKTCLIVKGTGYQ